MSLYKNVVIHVVQPFLDHIDREDISAEELVTWAKEEVAPKAQQAWNGEGEYKPGSHCRWCRVRQTCRARAEQNLADAKEDFAPNQLTIAEVANLLPRLDGIKSWCDDVQAYALDQAINHRVAVPGYKIVAGRSSRSWPEEEAVVVSAMVEEGLDEEDIYQKKLIGLTAAEKLLGKKSKVFDLCVRSSGKPTLVPNSDKREPLDSQASAAADFS